MPGCRLLLKHTSRKSRKAFGEPRFQAESCSSLSPNFFLILSFPKEMRSPTQKWYLTVSIPSEDACLPSLCPCRLRKLQVQRCGTRRRGLGNNLELGENASELSFALAREGSERNRKEGDGRCLTRSLCEGYFTPLSVFISVCRRFATWGVFQSPGC